MKKIANLDNPLYNNTTRPNKGTHADRDDRVAIWQAEWYTAKVA